MFPVPKSMFSRINFPLARDRRSVCKRPAAARDGPGNNSQNVEARFSASQVQVPLTSVSVSQADVVAAEGRFAHFHPGRHASQLITSSPLNHTPRYPSPSTATPPHIPSHDTHNLTPPARPEPVHLRTHPSPSPSPFNSSCETLNECCAPRAQAARPKSKMGLTKSQRIGILLGIDTAFFLVELTVGMSL